MAQVTIVAGGFGALGRAVVGELQRRGHVAVAVDQASPASTADPALVLGGVDLSDEAAVQDAYARVAMTHGELTGLVNVAGGFIWEPIIGGGLASWDGMYRTNLRTAVVSSRAALPHLRAAAGAIVNIGAAAAQAPGAGMGAYAASKAGVRALTESLADEVKGRGVRVNAVLPTIIDTPANRRDMPDADTSAWIRPEAVARVVAFLLSDEAAAITGASIPLSLRG